MIAFTPDETKIFKIIKKYAMSLKPPTTPRLAGGFVRDKIMGLECTDIDIALDNISGLDFATGIRDSLEGHPSVHKISANPAKSKHLETAVLHLGDHFIDFVQLRSESYADSRIPQIYPGTPQEDALRRDITINSLFYNLITDKIEDYTGRGMSDIVEKMIETPLDPEITLLDDPLRILRIFRFKAKFGFEISSRIYKAINTEVIRVALESKVSNERNGKEILKMLDYAYWNEGLLEIVKNNCVFSVFKPGVDISICFSKAADYATELKNLLNNDKIQNFLKNFKFKSFDPCVLKLYTIFQFFLNIKIKTGKKEEFVNVQIMKEGLKTSKSLFNAVACIENTIMLLKESDNMSLASIVVEGKEYWFETLAILYLTTGNNNFLTKIFEIFKNGYHEAYLRAPKVNGEFLSTTLISNRKFAEIIKFCLIAQIENPKMSQDELFMLYNKANK